MNLTAQKTIKQLKRTYREYDFVLGRHINRQGREGFQVTITTPEGMLHTLNVLLPLDSQLEAVAKLHELEGKDVRKDVAKLMVGIVGEELDRYVRSEDE